MTAHLLQIAVGPVQEFIAQARRTRDLWYGSHLLSEVSRAVACSLAADDHVRLIFPALDQNKDEDKAELAACVEPFRTVGGKKVPPLAVANIILAEIKGADEKAVRTLAESARDYMQRFWKDELAERVRQEDACGALLAADSGAIWDEQINTFLEFTAAWTDVSEQSGGYRAARARLTQAIAARKSLRDFEPWTKHREGARKSSLDGARVSVLKDDKNEKRPQHLVRKYRLNENEQLDAVGLVKRAGGETKESQQSHELQFVPIFNVALAPWVGFAKTRFPKELALASANLREDGEDKSPGKIDWPRVKRRIACGHDLFCFDASIFLRSRWWPEFKELGIFEPPGLQDEKDKAKREAMEREWRCDVETWCRDAVGPRLNSNGRPRILDLMTEPHPYVACLAADGDGMGKAIDALGTAEEHRAFSRELAKFARAAREIVEEAHEQPDGTATCHLGSLVYSGGDDVLAFLPVSTALACADELRTKFTEIMEQALGRKIDLPTLSVGIGIGHVMESMADLLDLGRRAEKLAKGGHLKREEKDRNALAIVLDKRSGGTCQWRSQWSEWAAVGGPAGRLTADRGLLGKRLSMRKVHQIGALLRRLPAPHDCSSGDAPGFKRVLDAEVKRALERSEGDGEPLKPEEVGMDLGGPTYADSHKAVADWIDRMLIARAFAESVPKAKSRDTSTGVAA